MNADAQETLGRCAANLAVIAATLRRITDVDYAPDQREKDGLDVLAAEIDSIVEGIGTLLSGGGEK